MGEGAQPFVSLLAEAGMTKLVDLVAAIAERMDLAASWQSEIEEMKKRVAPEAVPDAIEGAAPDLG